MAFLAIPDIAVTVLPTAQDALRLLASAECVVSAVVTDLNMPRMDGFEFIERIRAEPRHQRLPIIVVSGDTDPATPERLVSLGANAFFPKPYSPHRCGSNWSNFSMQSPPIVPRSRTWRVLLTLLAPGILTSQMAAQTASPELQKIMDRLDRLEKQNQSLAEEVQQLRKELAEARGPAQPPAAAAPLEEKVGGG